MYYNIVYDYIKKYKKITDGPIVIPRGTAAVNTK